jgi:hypothetical protein
MENSKTARAKNSTLKNRGKKRKIKKKKKVRADFLKDFSKARGAESWVRRVPPPTRRTYRLDLKKVRTFFRRVDQVEFLAAPASAAKKLYGSCQLKRTFLSSIFYFSFLSTFLWKRKVSQRNL